MATKSTAIKYGGEVAVGSLGNPFGPMGNGNRPSIESGMGSAYHEDIYYYIYPPPAVTSPIPPIMRRIFSPQYYESTPGNPVGLGPCYSVYTDHAGAWSKFYFGGAGGNACGTTVDTPVTG